ncbi:MAG: hypothetical protein H6702_00335 [Myxococcales bacterium]|nr:hypothetical protein [Myxococcales bacterium]
MGDLRALEPLASHLTSQGLRLHLSATTAGGRAVARDLYPWPVSDAPLAIGAGRALDRIRPRLLVLEYLELWPAWIAACARRGIPVAVVDGRITHRSLRVRPLLARAAGRLAAFCAQTEADALAAGALGVLPDRIHVCGNGKHHRQGTPPSPGADLRAAVGAVEVVVGSLHPDEEAAALPALAASGLRALIAPRYPQRTASILAAAQRLGVSAGRRSHGAAGARWVVLDTLGELAAAYALGRVSIVGGTFGRRDGQNLVEPAAHGLPVVHGPRVANVAAEAAALRGRGAWPVDDWPQAFQIARDRLTDPGTDPRPALRTLAGAVPRQWAVLAPLLGTWTPPPGAVKVARPGTDGRATPATEELHG